MAEECLLFSSSQFGTPGHLQVKHSPSFPSQSALSPLLQSCLEKVLMGCSLMNIQCKSTIMSWKGGGRGEGMGSVWLWALIKESRQIQRRHKYYTGFYIVCCYQCATLQHILRLYSEIFILHHHVDLAKKLWNQRKCKIGDNTEKQKIGISHCLDLFIIKIKFTQYNNAKFFANFQRVKTHFFINCLK